MPLFLVMFTVICALPVATTAPGVAVLVPSAAFAQQEDEDDGDASFGEDLSSSILSNVLEESSGGGATAGDDDGTNTQIAVPMTDQDQRGANVGLNLALEEVTLECPPGFTLNSNGQCERTVTQDPVCEIGFTFNPETDKCESVGIPPSCPVDPDPAPPVVIFTYNPVTNKCQSDIIPTVIAEPACENKGNLNEETDLCIVSKDPICKIGTFNPVIDKCEQVQTQAPT